MKKKEAPGKVYRRKFGPQVILLLFLSSKPLSPIEISKKLNMSLSTTSKILLYFQEEGLVEELTGEHHGKKYVLTDGGKATSRMISHWEKEIQSDLVLALRRPKGKKRDDST